MSGTPEARGALVTSLIIRGLFFVILLAGVIGALLVYPLPAALILGALVFGAVIPIAIALPVIARRRRRQLQLAQQECPDAVIVRAEWNGAFMPSFVKDPHAGNAR